MNILFVHQNFPGQYRHLAGELARRAVWKVAALGDLKFVKNQPQIPGVSLHAYPTPRPASAGTHHYVRPLEGAVRRGQAVVRACMDLKKQGFVPDIVCAHPGWGEALFLRDVFPEARIVLYCEFYYRASGADVGFDPEFPSTEDDALRVRAKNAHGLLSLESCDEGVSPTQWQRQGFPKEFRDRIRVIHEGVDTDLVRPDPQASLVLPGSNLTLTAADEVVTYVARNLEPYRGFHTFMRAVPEIQRRRPKAHIVVVGNDGVSYGTPLPKGQTFKQKLLEEVGAKIDLSRLHFLGPVPYATLLKVYQVSSAHVYLTYPFVLSWSMLEAMAAGCAVVASSTAPVKEVITDGENGWLVDFFSPQALAERLDYVLSRPPELAAVRESARRRVVERYDLQRVCLPRQLEMIGAAAG